MTHGAVRASAIGRVQVPVFHVANRVAPRLAVVQSYTASLRLLGSPCDGFLTPGSSR